MIAFDNEIAAEGHEQIALVLYVFLLFLLDDSNFGHSFQGKAPRFVANWPDKLKPNRNRVGKIKSYFNSAKCPHANGCYQFHVLQLELCVRQIANAARQLVICICFVWIIPVFFHDITNQLDKWLAIQGITSNC